MKKQLLTRSLFKRILSLPKLIYRQHLQVEKLRVELQLAKGSLLFTECKLMNELRETTNSQDGWTPEMQEKELVRSKKFDREYLEHQWLHTKIEEKYHRELFKLQRLQNEFTALTSFAKAQEVLLRVTGKRAR